MDNLCNAVFFGESWPLALLKWAAQYVEIIMETVAEGPCP